MGALKKVINRLITCSQNFNAHILMNDGHMDIQEFWLKQLKKWSKEDLLGWGCFVWDWIWGICIFLKSRSNIEFSDINHRPSSSLSSLQTVCRPTLQLHDIRILISASAGLIMLAHPPTQYSNRQNFLQNWKTKMICQVLFQFYQFSLPNILLQTNFKAALQFSGSLEKFHN